MEKKLYVGNLPFSATTNSLADLFSQYGTVESAKIITDRDSGRSKGFAFVEMSSSNEAAEAVRAMVGFMMEGRPLTVSEAKPQAPRENRSGGGGYGGDRGGSRNRY